MVKEKIFIGISFGDDFTEDLANLSTQLDSNLWGTISKDNLHLTVLYVGEVDKSIIPFAEEILGNIATRTRPLSFMGGRTIIMRPDEPTMLWIKYERSKYFENLVGELKKYFKKIGSWEFQNQKSYNKNSNQTIAHITIARIKGGGMLETLLPPLQINKKLESFTARSMSLYRSTREIETNEMKYEILNSWDLQN